MAYKGCDYCNANTSAKPFFTCEGVIMLPGRFEKKVGLRTCRDCYYNFNLSEYGFRRGN